MVSQKKLTANRRNAQKSTGPKTEQGKRKARHNSTTHGLFCQSLLLPHDDPIIFHTLRDSYLLALKPQNLPELQLVDQIVSAVWRLRRVQDAEDLLHVHARNDYVTNKSLKNDPDSDPVSAVASSETYFDDRLSNQLDRIAKHEQRYQRTIHRCYRELRLLRKDQLEDLPTCPFFDYPKDVFHLNPKDIPQDETTWPEFDDSYYDPYLTEEQKVKLQQQKEQEEQEEQDDEQEDEQSEIDQNEPTAQPPQQPSSTTNDKPLTTNDQNDQNEPTAPPINPQSAIPNPQSPASTPDTDTPPPASHVPA